MRDVKSVFYNDGNNEDLFALVTHDDGDGQLDLIVFSAEGVPGVVKNVPRRDKADYGAEGGGVTWHL